MALVLSESDVQLLLDMPTALEAVEESLRSQAAGEVRIHPRQRLNLPDRVLLNYMFGADSKAGWMGAKLYSVARGVAQFIVLLYRTSTGELAALIEADYLGQMRTGAASGVATKYMARPDARVAAIIGTGLQARTQLTAIARVRRLERIVAFSRDPERRAEFCSQMSERLSIPVVLANSAEECVRAADIVITATRSAKPVLFGAWLAPGVHVNAMGSNVAQKRELDDEAIARAGIVAVDLVEQARMESGDLIQAFGDDAARWESVCELAQIVAARLPGRNNAQQITLFESQGVASWDIAVAARVFALAEKRGVGRHINIGPQQT
jgi:alanine dehydrogenase